MEPKPHGHLLDWSNKLVNCRSIVERKWLLVKGQVCVVTVVKDGRPEVGKYEGILVMDGYSRQMWGNNARRLLAAVKRDM